MDDSQQLRANFLERSALTLFLSAPATSWTLARETEELLHVHIPAVSHGSRQCCTACGVILLSPWTVETKIATTKVRFGKTSKGKKIMRRKVRAQRCSTCRRVMKSIAIFDPSIRRREDQSVSKADDHFNKLEASSSDATLERTNKPSSKKRAKARKDREGLQALFNNSAQTRAAPSLNLTDLMRK